MLSDSGVGWPSPAGLTDRSRAKPAPTTDPTGSAVGGGSRRRSGPIGSAVADPVRSGPARPDSIHWDRYESPDATFVGHSLSTDPHAVADPVLGEHPTTPPMRASRTPAERATHARPGCPVSARAFRGVAIALPGVSAGPTDDPAGPRRTARAAGPIAGRREGDIGRVEAGDGQGPGPGGRSRRQQRSRSGFRPDSDRSVRNVRLESLTDLPATVRPRSPTARRVARSTSDRPNRATADVGWAGKTRDPLPTPTRCRPVDPDPFPATR